MKKEDDGAPVGGPGVVKREEEQDRWVRQAAHVGREWLCERSTQLCAVTHVI